MTAGWLMAATDAVSEPSPWLSLTVEALGALGSAGAAIVAVVLAAHQIRERREAQDELRELRHREERSQAVGVVASVEGAIRLGTSGMGQTFEIDGVWEVKVQNTSTAPIRAVHATVWSRVDSSATAGADVAAAIPPGESATVLTAPAMPVEVVREPEYWIFFRDAAGATWRLDHEGDLARLD